MAPLKENKNYSIAFDRRFVFYDDTNGGISPFWEQIRKTEIDYGEKVYNNLINKNINLDAMRTRGAQQLMDMADQEQIREEALMRTIDPNFPHITDETEYIRTFNLTYKNKEEFKLTIQRIINAINYSKEQNFRAPILFSWFISNFNTAFRANISAKLTNANIDAFLANDDNLWEQIIDKSINDAFVRLEQTSEGKKNEHNKDVYGVGSDYAGLAKLIQGNVFFRDLLIDRLHIDDVRKYLIDYTEDNTTKLNKAFKKRRKALKRKTIEEKEQVVNRERNLQGELYEYVSAKIVESLKQTSKDIKVKAVGIKNNIGATDAVVLFSQQTELDLADIEESYLAALSGDKQAEISRQVQKWYNNLEEGNALDSLFIVNTSNKLYSMSHTHPFSKTANIEDAATVLTTNFSQTNSHTAGISTALDARMFARSKDVDDMVALFYNTLEGAFLHDREKQIKELIRNIFVVAAGSLLFSDYVMVGRESTRSANMIHLFNLNEVYIPLSVILRGLGEAYELQSKEGYEYLRLNYLRRGKGILYPKSNTEDRYEGQQVSKAFRTQRENVKSNAKFTIQFVSNFRSIIAKIAEGII